MSTATARLRVALSAQAEASGQLARLALRNADAEPVLTDAARAAVGLAAHSQHAARDAATALQARDLVVSASARACEEEASARAQAEADLASIRTAVATRERDVASSERHLLLAAGEARAVASVTAAAVRVAQRAAMLQGDLNAAGRRERALTHELQELQSGSGTVFRQKLKCPVCSVRDRACVLEKCGHTHCIQCVDQAIEARTRKCPSCAVPFTANHVQKLYFQ
jgi:E3 ubiquitin-protein ligase BRE1